MDEEKILKSHRRVPIADILSMPTTLNFGRPDIERILPYRAPFLLVDNLCSLDLNKQIISGNYHLSPHLPVFQGHFPNYPLYPGSLQVEAIGQLGLSLVHFIGNNTTAIGTDAAPPKIRATRICGAYYRGEARPGNTLDLIAKVVDYDAYFGKILGQSLVDGSVATVALLEVAFLDES